MKLILLMILSKIGLILRALLVPLRTDSRRIDPDIEMRRRVDLKVSKGTPSEVVTNVPLSRSEDFSKR